MKKKKSLKVLIYFALGLIVVTTLLVVPRFLVMSRIRKGILIETDSLRHAGYFIQYDSLISDAWSKSVGFAGLIVRFPSHDSCASNAAGLSADRIMLQGINYLSLLFKKKIHIRTLSTKTLIWRRTQKKGTSPEAARKQKIHGLEIDELLLGNTTIETLDSANCTISFSAHFDVEANAIRIGEPFDDGRQWMIAEARILSPEIELPEKFYTISAAAITFGNGRLTMDSFAIQPEFDKLTFAQKNGVQTDRISCEIPQLTFAGLTMEQSGFRASEARFSVTAEIFRDKRYPFPHKAKKMPVEFLRGLPISINIETLHIDPSNIAYEEFPEGGTKQGRISFHDLTADIHNISNTSADDMTMTAQSGFMKKGLLKAKFKFPSDPGKTYSVSGSLTDLEMAELNPLLVPMAQAEVKSGYLTQLAFQYDYNSYRADGSVTLDYNDLTVARLEKNSKNTNKFVTLILQSFILKKDMDKHQRQGKILFYRDPERSIFNYWWKAIWSGIKELFNLDRVMKIDRGKKEK